MNWTEEQIKEANSFAYAFLMPEEAVRYARCSRTMSALILTIMTRMVIMFPEPAPCVAGSMTANLR